VVGGRITAIAYDTDTGRVGLTINLPDRRKIHLWLDRDDKSVAPGCPKLDMDLPVPKETPDTLFG
jgi:hypothetical protein